MPGAQLRGSRTLVAWGHYCEKAISEQANHPQSDFIHPSGMNEVEEAAASLQLLRIEMRMNDHHRHNNKNQNNRNIFLRC